MKYGNKNHPPGYYMVVKLLINFSFCDVNIHSIWVLLHFIFISGKMCIGFQPELF